MSDTTTTRGATHPVNVLHLVFGLVFLGIAGTWALGTADVLDVGSAEWTLPLVLVVAGAAGLVASVAKGLGRPAEAHDEIERYE